MFNHVNTFKTQYYSSPEGAGEGAGSLRPINFNQRLLELRSQFQSCAQEYKISVGSYIRFIDELKESTVPTSKLRKKLDRIPKLNRIPTKLKPLVHQLIKLANEFLYPFKPCIKQLRNEGVRLSLDTAIENSSYEKFVGLVSSKLRRMDAVLQEIIDSENAGNGNKDSLGKQIDKLKELLEEFPSMPSSRPGSSAGSFKMKLWENLHTFISLYPDGFLESPDLKITWRRPWEAFKKMKYFAKVFNSPNLTKGILRVKFEILNSNIQEVYKKNSEDKLLQALSHWSEKLLIKMQKILVEARDLSAS